MKNIIYGLLKLIITEIIAKKLFYFLKNAAFLLHFETCFY
jgi:hypothetical protein